MKKIFKNLCAIALSFVLLLGLTGCGEKINDENGQQEQGESSGIVWPSNQYTNLIPKPDGASIYDESEINNAYYVGHNIDLEDWTIAECKVYAEKLKEAGFTLPGSGMDSVIVSDSESTYSFGAKNSDGVYVTVGSSYNSGRISIQLNKNE